MPEIPGRDEQILQAIINGTEYTQIPQSRIEYLLLQLKAIIEGGGGVLDYTELENKPSINNVTLVGNKSLSDLGIVIDSALSTTSENPVQNKVITNALNGKVNTETGKGLSTNDYTNVEKASVALSAETLTPISESAYEALTTKDKPLYFIYD